MLTIRPCMTPTDYALATQLTRDYLAWLNLDLAYQGVDAELDSFAQMYGPPGGAFLLAFMDGQVGGGVGLRTLRPGGCEMKRLYVYARYRGEGLGLRLCEALLQHGRALGYRYMRLDTLEQMTPAIALYARLGFTEIEPYCENPFPTARFMEYDLTIGTETSSP